MKDRRSDLALSGRTAIWLQLYCASAYLKIKKTEDIDTKMNCQNEIFVPS
jgi:hypothetical protein